MKTKRRSLLLFLALTSMSCAHRRKPVEPPPLVLTDASGAATTEFQLHDSLLVDVRGLEPRQGYEVEIVSAEGEVVVTNRLSTDATGRIPPTVLWYAIGSRPCWQGDLSREPGPLPYSRIADVAVAGRTYTLKISSGGQLVRSSSFRVAEAMLRPTLFATDARGCPKTGFLIGEEDIWVVGRNFPPGSLVRLWAVSEKSDWRDGDPLTDRTKQYGYDLPRLVELAPGETELRRLLWPRGLTSVGSYDIVAEAVAYPFGTYREGPRAEALDVVSQRSFSGFVVQRRPGAGQPIEVDIAGSVASPFTFRSTFLTNENVYVGVDPALQPGLIGKSADVYIVADKSDAQWTVGTMLNDVTGTVETITVNGICGNCWNTLAWTAPLAVGRYDVVLDFDHDGMYTPGVDLIDSLDPAGFTVSEARVDQISFNYTGSAAVPLYDNLAVANVTAPEFISAGHVVKPAAWVMGGSHSVRVRFAAVPTVTQAQVWAAGGVGGLASSGSPVTVTFSGGIGQADFPVILPPAAVTRTAFTWDWKYKAGASTVEMGQTGEHLLYTVLATPQAPQVVPWVRTLDVACTLAQGETTAAGATRKIWSDFYNNAGGQYDTVSGAPRYASSNFNLTLWLANYATANIGVVNCYDMGQAVVVFANALGAGAEYVYTGPFGYLNLVKPIGKGWSNNPFSDSGFYSPNPVVDGDFDHSQGRSSFGNHAFARLGGQIYDASGGQVDTDSDPDTLPAGTPRDLDGDDSWTASYRNRVIDDNPVSNPGTPTAESFDVE
jgi:hypothetical protein